MANRVTIYGATGDPATERLRNEMRSMSLNCDFFDIKDRPDILDRLRSELIEEPEIYPKVEVLCANNPGSVFLTNPDITALRQTLYGENILGITSYWI
jgi:hypothetical protein